MLLKAKPLKPTKPEPICGQAGNKVVQPIRCTAGGEVMVYQVNESSTVGDGVNKKNKDGRLILGDDGQCLRNVRVDPDGTVVTRVDKPIDINLETVEVQGHVWVDNPLTVNPVRVANMPDEMRIQEGLNIVQTPIEAHVASIGFEGCSAVVIPHQCRVYSIHLTVCEPTFIEVVGITGEMWTGELKFNWFPLFIRVDELRINVREYVLVGGYVIYENC